MDTAKGKVNATFSSAFNIVKIYYWIFYMLKLVVVLLPAMKSILSVTFRLQLKKSSHCFFLEKNTLFPHMNSVMSSSILSSSTNFLLEA